MRIVFLLSLAFSSPLAFSNPLALKSPSAKDSQLKSPQLKNSPAKSSQGKTAKPKNPKPDNSQVKSPKPESSKSASPKLKNPSTKSPQPKNSKPKSPQVKSQKLENPQLEGLENSLEESPSKKPVTQKIKQIFQDFIAILETEKVQSLEYSKAVSFLERSLYNNADFETLKTLSQVYELKKDFKNQENVLKVLVVSDSKNPESFYLLAGAYKNLLTVTENEELRVGYKDKIFENYKSALKRDPKHLPSYLALLELLKIQEPEGEKHSKASLSLVLDMIKNLKDEKYYSLLCKAYYDNRFLKQARRACFRSVKKNPKDPVGPLILSLSLSSKKQREGKLLLTAKAFPQSFFVQYRVGLYFMDHSPRSAIFYLTKAHELDPEHLHLNKVLADFLLQNKELKKSYDYYLKACLLTDGAFLPAFRKARGFILRNNEAELVLKFDKGIKECFQEARAKKRKAKKT